MARRKKNFFKLSKKTRDKLFPFFVFLILGLGLWIYFHRPAPVKRATIPKKSKKKVEAPRSRAAQEPIVYYKKIPTAQPAAQKIRVPALRVSGAPKLAFVLDDMGNTHQYIPELQALGSQVTYAILPLLSHSREFDRLSQETGAEVILHLPLESVKGTIPGPGLITSSMPDDFVLEELRRNLNSVPHHIGVNNHMGSKGTADPRLMSLILGELKRRNLFFLDSRTTSQSLAPKMARELGLPILGRDEFLDNVDSPDAIRAEIQQMANKARRKGYAIGIGHYRLNTLRVFQEEIARLKREGFEIVTLSQLLSNP